MLVVLAAASSPVERTALNRMQTRMDEIVRTRNTLRQEDITEQIEIILLSAESMPG